MRIDVGKQQIRYDNSGTSEALEVLGDLTVTGDSTITGDDARTGDLELTGDLAVIGEASVSEAANGLVLTDLGDAADGQVAILQMKSVDIDVAVSDTAVDFIPANALILQATTRVTTTVVATTGVNFTVVPETSTPLLSATVTPLTAGVAFYGPADFWDIAGTPQDIVLTPDAGSLDTGVVRVTILYVLLTDAA